jgi:hypothetical protein
MSAEGESLAEIFERVAQARGQLLRVERAPLAGPAGARISSAVRLTFDVGVLTLRPGGSQGDLEVEVGHPTDAGPPVFVSASEEDPWWRVIGCPLIRVQVRAAGGLHVQFQGDRDNPRRFALSPGHGGIEALMEG